jgi:hypothetical protein
MRAFSQFFGDRDYTFHLRIKEIDEIQRICEAGIGDIATRVMAQRPHYRDVYDTIRLGLIGGGLPAAEAKRLVDLYVDERPLAIPGDPASPMLVAMNIYNEFWFGIRELSEFEDAFQTGKLQGGTETESTSPPSTDKAPSSGGRRSKSKK